MVMMGPQRLIAATTRKRETRSVVEEMVAAANRATRPQPKGRAHTPSTSRRSLRGPALSMGVGKHLLKDCVTMSSCIRGTLDLKCKA
jgi:hypothetical protein